MNLSIPELESILSEFSSLTDQTIIEESGAILSEWKESLESLPMALEIIQSSQNANLFLFAAQKIESNLEKQFNDLDEDAIKTICEVCIGRIISNRENHLLPQNNLESLYSISAIIASNSNQLFKEISSSDQLFPEEQTCFFYYLLTELNKDKEFTESQLELKSFFYNNPSLLDLLRQTIDEPVSYYWVALYCILVSFFEPYTQLSEFLPQIQKALANEDNITPILNCFDNINNSCDSDDYPYVKDMILIMIEFVKQAFENPTQNKVNHASFIWCTIIDSSYDFFVSDLEFTDFVFTAFAENLPAFLYYNLDDDFNDFFNILDIYTSRLGLQENDASLSFMSNYISVGLDFIIEQLDIVSDLTMPRDDRLTPFCLYDPRMDNCLRQIFRTADSDQDKSDNSLDKEFEQFLSHYFHPKIQNLTNGALYAFSFTPKNTRKIFASIIGVKIAEMPEKLIASVYFIASCSQFIPEFNYGEIELTFAIAELEYAPQYMVVEALCELSKICPNLFFENGDGYIQIILKMLEQASLTEINDILPDLFITIFNILYCLQHMVTNSDSDEQNPEQQETIQAIDTFFEKVRSLFIEKISLMPPIDDMSTLKIFKDFAKDIIENSQNADESMNDFYSSLFGQIEVALNPAIYYPQNIAQIEICDLILTALERKWVANKEPYMEYIEVMLEKCPLPQHFDILSYLIDFLPNQKVAEFLSHIDEQPPDILRHIIFFFFKVAHQNPIVLTDMVNFDQLLFPLNTNNITFIDLELDLFMILMNSQDIQIPPEDADKIAQLFAQKAFSFDLENIETYYEFSRGNLALFAEVIKKGVIFLRFSGIKYGSLKETLDYILEVIGFSDQNITDFSASYMQDDENVLKDGIRKLAIVLIEIYKQKVFGTST